MVRILCVEDEADLREDLMEELEDHGFEVATAADGASGLSRLLQFRPHLVISDCLMPVMSGPEMLQEMRRRHPELNDLPFIFLSAHARKADVEAGMDVGAAAYLTKPVDYERLLAEIARLLGVPAGPGAE